MLTVTALGDSIPSALEAAYDTISKVNFEGMFYRKDIAHRALEYLRKPPAVTYADAGVNIDAGNRLVDLIKPLVKKTRRIGADADIGGFGGVFDLAPLGYKDPVLVSGTDGVGTKLKIAQGLNWHDTIGIKPPCFMPF